jgi:hypothetical protein
METYSIVIKDNQIKIFINDVLHLMIKKDEFTGLQSWIIGDEKKTYYIEFYLKSGDILAEYDNKEKWTKILTLLNQECLCTDFF